MPKFIQKWNPSFRRFMASAVTLSGFAGGEYLPFPASEGRAFPFLLTLDGCPLLQQISLKNIGFHKK
jgi:hypothetical protein